MLTYLKGHAHMTFEECPFNDVDQLIFAQMSYCDFSVSEKFKEKPISCAAKYVFHYSTYDHATNKRFNFQIHDDKKLLFHVIMAKRYSDVKFIDFKDEYDPDEGLQFSALTLMMPDGTIFVIFRGTDNTLTGWKENCEMAFNMPIPAQREACAYLNEIAGKYSGQICVCGHSKGGNLAVYSAAFADEAVQDRIVCVTSFDGPGMPSEVKELERYKRISKRLNVILPRCSIVGLFFEQPDNIRYIDSRLRGVLQHYLYLWKTQGEDFVYIDSLASRNELIGKAIQTFLMKLTKEQREQFVEAIYEIIESTQAETLNDLASGWLKNTIPIASAILKTDTETYRMCLDVMNTFWNSLSEVMKERKTEAEA